MIGGLQAAPDGDALFSRAMDLQHSNLAESRALFQAAGLQYRSEAEQESRRRGALLYNAGNAFFLAGENGPAIVAYRKAGVELPGHPLLKANLDFVRRQSGNALEAEPHRWTHRVFFWHGWSRATRWTLLAAVYLAGWGVVLGRQWLLCSAPRWLLPALGGVFLLLAASLVTERLHEILSCRGVVIAKRVELRKGPGYGYAPAFAGPFFSGTEAEIERVENGWALLAKPGHFIGWCPFEAVEIWQGTPR